MLTSIDGSKIVQQKDKANVMQAENLGKRIAKELLSNGGREILSQARGCL